MEKIILFGAGKDGRMVYELLQQRGEENIIECFCDNNSALWGQKIGESIICSYEECRV